MTAFETTSLLSPAEVARRLGVGRMTVYRRIADGSLPAVRISGDAGPLRVPADELERWIERRRTDHHSEETGS